MIGDDIAITVLDTRGNGICIGIDPPVAFAADDSVEQHLKAAPGVARLAPFWRRPIRACDLPIFRGTSCVPSFGDCGFSRGCSSVYSGKAVVLPPEWYPVLFKKRHPMSHDAKVHYLSRTTFDPNDSTVQAKAILDAEMNKRMDLVHQLAVRLSALEATIAAVDAARHAAIAAGWTEEQLLDLGLGAVENSKQSTGRRVALSEGESSVSGTPAQELAG